MFDVLALQMNNASPLSTSVKGLRWCCHVGAQTSVAIQVNGNDLVRFQCPTLFLMMEYHLGEKGREGREWGRGCGVCGLPVKVLLVGSVYDTLPVGCKAVIHSGWWLQGEERPDTFFTNYLLI